MNAKISSAEFSREIELTKRRWFFGECGVGLAGIAATSLLAQQAAGSLRENANPLAAKQPHFPARAKRVIYMFNAGAPSQRIGRRSFARRSRIGLLRK